MKFYYLLFLLLLIPMVSAVDDEYIKFNEGVDLTTSCISNGTYCSNNAVCNITITYPNNSLFLDNVMMTNKLSFHNYSVVPSTLGSYNYNIVCSDNGDSSYINGIFVVNGIGKYLSTAQSMMYIILFIISLLIMLIMIYAGFAAPFNNPRDQMTGYILSIENLKYVKILSWALVYLLLMLIFYFGWMISYGYLDMEFLGKLFNIGFYILLIVLFPLFVIGVYVVIANWIRDNKIANALTGGLRIR